MLPGTIYAYEIHISLKLQIWNPVKKNCEERGKCNGTIFAGTWWMVGTCAYGGSSSFPVPPKIFFPPWSGPQCNKCRALGSAALLDMCHRATPAFLRNPLHEYFSGKNIINHLEKFRAGQDHVSSAWKFQTLPLFYVLRPDTIILYHIF